MKRSNALAVFLVLAMQGMPAVAEEKKPAQGKPAVEVRSLTIHPAPMPRPALKYHLLPTYLEQMPGNAAQVYLKSLLLLRDPSLAKSLELLERPFATGAQHIPFDKMPREQSAKALGEFKSALNMLEMASRRERCDWEQPIRDHQRDVYAILLPEAQVSRSFARLLVVKARLAIAQGNYDEAFSALRVGVALARDVGNQEFLVSGLVGLTIEGMMSDTMEALIALPGAPNLYWTITELPQPLISFRRAFSVEGVTVYLVFPKLGEAKTAQWTPQQAEDALVDVLTQSRTLTEALVAAKILAPQDVKAFVQKACPNARKELIARGWKEKQVDAMPPAQIVLADAAEAFDESRDDLFKWFSVPYCQAREGLKAAEERLDRTKSGDAIPLRGVLLPAVSACHIATARVERGIATLRVIEAIRLYAANHGGKLPESLDMIGEVPIPGNPVTGKAFPYKVEGTTAILDADGPNLSRPRQYRLSLAK